ncbi:TonB family protein [Mucilaginibacter limnophilus]|uniref:TonB family protein n=1 Tax=Mucilaginibacter limnophilus TaxID=1932778 RepID=A0A3S2WZE8_9SPHI|nr:TonB family protein [Mucilaginibacter limnophilus]RVU01714.1 TonB family protein [Mucilaginibacter limnophilus]
MAKQTDISKQIQQYLSGELDAKAMHRLEREALNDPFLADAIEGYEGVKADQQHNLDDIASRLQDRTQAKVKRLVPWKIISVAASVIVVLTIGGLWFYTDDKVTSKEVMVAMRDKTELKKPETLKSPAPPAENEQAVISAPPVAEPRMTYVRKPRVASVKSPRKNFEAEIHEESPPVDVSALASANFETAKPKDSVSLEDRIVNGFFNDPADKATPVAASKPIEKALQGKVEGVNISQEGSNLHNPKTLNGLVIDNGIPLPGATVKLKGTRVMAQTDAEGKFKIPVDKDKSELEITSIGYLSQNVSVKKQDTLLIAMQPNKQSLNEVVVVGYGTKKQHKAMPADGWKEFNNYLKDEAKSPDGKEGTVKLSFVVQPNGDLTEFKILKSVSKQTDEAAIDLIKDGPTWLSSSNGKPETVTISIKFTL